MPFNDSEFEIINALAMIYYLDIDRFLKEASRVLCFNGTLFFCTSNKCVNGFVKAPFTTSYYSIPELNNILKFNGFKGEFFGSFPSYENSQSKGFFKLRVFVKNILKVIVTSFPYGDNLWNVLRNRYLGELKKLPKYIDDIEIEEDWNEDFNMLDSESINSKYRVIYCIAKLEKKQQ